MFRPSWFLPPALAVLLGLLSSRVHRFYPSQTPGAILTPHELFLGTWFRDPLMSCARTPSIPPPLNHTNQPCLRNACIVFQRFHVCKSQIPKWGRGTGLGVGTGQGPAPLWASALLSLEESDRARGLPYTHPLPSPKVYGLRTVVSGKISTGPSSPPSLQSRPSAARKPTPTNPQLEVAALGPHAQLHPLPLKAAMGQTS